MNFKGTCLRCGHKCSVAIIYCVSCLEFLEANVPMAQCGFAYPDGRHCRRDGRWHNGFCDAHQPPKIPAGSE